MNAILVALLLVTLTQTGTRAPVPGDAQAGKALWEGAATQCKNCHGVKGEGAFGPDLAGRQLSVMQDVYKSESDTNQRNQAIGFQQGGEAEELSIKGGTALDVGGVDGGFEDCGYGWHC